ncbi:MAG: hypothetical protein U1E39_08420 [Planctomycetota bacterium]
MNVQKSAIGIAIVGLVVGALVGLLLAKLRVPPPAFTGASFGNSAPKRTLKSAAVHYWLDPAKVPMAPAQRIDWQKWTGNTRVDLTPSPAGAQYAATATAMKIEDIVTMALVVIVTNSDSNADETYINFLSDEPTDPTKFGIHHFNAWLTNDAKPTLVVDYFYGGNTNYYPNAKRTDDTSYPP